jgi:hypothetical protein
MSADHLVPICLSYVTAVSSPARLARAYANAPEDKGQGKVEGKAEEDGHWSCAGCTFANEPQHLACAMCGTVRADEQKGGDAANRGESQHVPPALLEINVNFQPENADIPRGFVFDSGAAFGKRGVTPLSVMQDTAIGSVMPAEYCYGWSTAVTQHLRDRKGGYRYEWRVCVGCVVVACYSCICAQCRGVRSKDVPEKCSSDHRASLRVCREVA